jgi:hypothetical protein
MMFKPNGTDLQLVSEFNSLWADRIARLILVGLLFDIAAVFVSKGPWRDVLTILADMLIIAGVWGELFFAKRAREADDGRVAEANKLAAEAIERAAKADLARVELEAKLLPRALNQEQWDFIQGLRSKFSVISIAFETDAETHWFANEIRDAFFSAGIAVAMYPRAADVHSFGTFIYEPEGFDGARAKTVGPLIDIFGMTELFGAVAVITKVPADIIRSREDMRPEMCAPLDSPMIIVGGRFVIPPPHLEEQAKAARAARNRMNNKGPSLPRE